MSFEINPATYFDTPERDSDADIRKEITLFESNTVIKEMLEGYPSIAVIINNHRQIVAFNNEALDAFKARGYTEILGKRFGEAIKCIHHSSSFYGCGTTKSCKQCGAANAIRTTMAAGVADEEECRITVDADGKEKSFDLMIHTQPLNIYDRTYTIFAIRDISGEKRRDALEKIFFHDVLNTAGALNGILELLPDAETVQEKEELTSVLKETSKQLLNEILAQRELRMAEDGLLNPQFKKISVNKIISTAFDLYKNHEISIGKYLEREKFSGNEEIFTDSTLLIRSLGNLIKNALEASASNDVIKIFATADSEHVSFSVLNNSVIPEYIQLQLFQRSFSTKQTRGRGIGLYSVKLIVEQYLQGKVRFVSNETERTVFTIELPIAVLTSDFTS